jgi:hypothetical protein
MGHPIWIAVALGASLALGGCMTSARAPESVKGTTPYVSSLDLSQTRGQVGAPFAAEVSYNAHRLGVPEYRVDSLPPGLKFDPRTARIEGVPKADGFFAVTVAVRKKRKPGMHFDTVDGAWYSQRFEIAIYKPVKEGDDMAGWESEPVANADDLDLDLDSF